MSAKLVPLCPAHETCPEFISGDLFVEKPKYEYIEINEAQPITKAMRNAGHSEKTKVYASKVNMEYSKTGFTLWFVGLIKVSEDFFLNYSLRDQKFIPNIQNA